VGWRPCDAVVPVVTLGVSPLGWQPGYGTRRARGKHILDRGRFPHSADAPRVAEGGTALGRHPGCDARQRKVDVSPMGRHPRTLSPRSCRRAHCRRRNAPESAHTGCAVGVPPVGRRPRGAVAPTVAEGASPVGRRRRVGGKGGRIAGVATTWSRRAPVTQWACRRSGDAPVALLHRSWRSAHRRYGGPQSRRTSVTPWACRQWGDASAMLSHRA